MEKTLITDVSEEQPEKPYYGLESLCGSTCPEGGGPSGRARGCCWQGQWGFWASPMRLWVLRRRQISSHFRRCGKGQELNYDPDFRSFLRSKTKLAVPLVVPSGVGLLMGLQLAVHWDY